jgi:hypothetical protein
MKATTISKKISAADALTAQIQTAQTARPLKKSEKKETKSPQALQPPSLTSHIDTQILAASLHEGMDNPRFSAVSTHAKSVLAYLNSTVPKFKTSAIVRKYVEAGLAADYPDLWERTSTSDTPPDPVPQG